MEIDGWTIALQAVNFLILVGLLRHFLYKPVLAAIDRRQAEAGRLLDDAAHRLEAAETEHRQAAAARAAIDAETERLMAEARGRVGAEIEAVHAKAVRDADALIADGRATLDAERTAAVHELRAHAVELGVDIAGTLLAAAAPGAQLSAFLARALAKLDALPMAERIALTEQAAVEGIRIVTATPLGDSDRAQCTERLQRLFGSDVDLTFADDASLLAGIEIHFSHTVIRDTWRDLIGQIGLELDHHADARRVA